MKHKLLGVLFVLFVLTSCKDDESDSPSGNPTPSPTSGTVSATINGNDFSGEENVSRYLSYGAFIIKSVDDGSILNFELQDFVGNATYSLTEGSGNSVEYFTISSGEFVEFRSLSGEIVVSDFDEATKTYNATFNVNFGKIGNTAITISGEGSYNNIRVIEVTRPGAGEITAFFQSDEYFEFLDSAKVFENQVFLATLESEESNLNFEVQLNLDSPNSATITTDENSYLMESNEILLWAFDEDNLTATGHFKNLDSDEDLEIWFEDIPVDTVSESFTNIVYNYNEEIIHFERGQLSEEVENDGSSRYQFAAFNVDSDTIVNHYLIFQMDQTVNTGFTQPLSGRALYVNPDNPSTNYGLASAVMTVELTNENWADVEVDIQGRGILTGEGVRIIE